jgi:hypothetical protein
MSASHLLGLHGLQQTPGKTNFYAQQFGFNLVEIKRAII